MSDELKQLQALYIAGVDSMKEADAQRYLALLEADYGAEYREVRITALIRRLKAIERTAHVEQRKKDEYSRLAEQQRQFNEITDGWIAQGATFRTLGDGAYEIWDYGDIELYRWGGSMASRATVPEMLADAQRIDAEFSEMLRKEKDAY